MRASYLKIIIALLILPIFFSFSPLGLGPSYIASARGTVLPIGIIFFGIFFMAFFLPRYVNAKNISFGSKETFYPLLIYVFFVVLSYMLGLLFQAFNNSAINTIFFIQTLVFPIVYLTIRASLTDHSIKQIEEILYMMCILIGLINFLYVFQTLIGFNPSTRFTNIVDYIGPFYNFKIKRFYPIICCVIFLGTIYFLIKEKKLFKSIILITFLISTLVIILSSWGRTSIFSLFVSLIFAVLYFRRFKDFVLHLNNALVLIFVGSLIFSIFFSDFYFGIARLNESFFAAISGEYATGDDIRFSRMYEAFLDGVLSPFGLMFDYTNFVNPENGYLDIALRGGLFSLMSFVVFLFMHFKNFNLPITSNDINFIHYFRVVLICLIIANFFLNIFTEPYLSIFCAIIFALYSRVNQIFDIKDFDNAR